MADQGFYIGIDIDDSYAVVTYVIPGMAEPATVSMIAGSEVFQIPLVIAKKKGIGQWYIGEEAERIAQEEQATVVDTLLSRALHREELMVEGERYQAEELLVLFVRKLMLYAGGLQGMHEPEGMAVTVPTVTEAVDKLFLRVGEKLGIAREKCLVMDHKAAFYYYAMSQQEDLYLHDVCLYDYRDGRVRCLCLERNLSTDPQIITIEETMADLDADMQDDSFYQVLVQHMKGHIVSSVYLVGNAFEGGWMQKSLDYMCRGRRAFMGKNLYAKGACYGMLVSCKELPWQYVYLGDNEMKVNVNLKVKNRSKEEFYTLISAGDNWYETEGGCEVIPDDTNTVSIWMQLPNSREAKVEELMLSDLPERENRTTRLRITVKPVSDTEIRIQIKDMGFGEIVKGSDMTWEYNMCCI